MNRKFSFGSNMVKTNSTNVWNRSEPIPNYDQVLYILVTLTPNV